MKPMIIQAVLLIATIGLTGCETLPAQKSNASPPRLPATKMGVRTTVMGSAVAEVDRPVEQVFDITEAELRRDMKVTFVNRTLGRIEASTTRFLFVADIALLTTGKTGLSLTATAHGQKRGDYAAARELADRMVRAIQAAPPLPAPSSVQP